MGVMSDGKNRHVRVAVLARNGLIMDVHLVC